MDNKLIPMTTFVADQWQNKLTTKQQLDNIYNYSQFLKQPLALWMFVPCDQNGNILSEPQMIEKRIGFDETEIDYDYAEVEVYKKAKSRVLFEGFEFESKDEVTNKDLKLTIFLSTFQFMNCDENGLGGGDLFGQNIDALAYADLNLTLTETAIKSIYGS